MFFFSDEIKSLGNEAYQKNEFYLALEYYERVRIYTIQIPYIKYIIYSA